MRKMFCPTTILTLILAGAAVAQPTQLPNSTARSSYISVMSKAGTPTPRPQVPNRQVQMPAGASAGYDYYYGYRWRGGGGAASPSYANEAAPQHASWIRHETALFSGVQKLAFLQKSALTSPG